ncbi:MAG: hypothetical protein KAI66_14920 [Lentisphaeria bacterium]|nr:hypothetical protein [Lentisphaeria bacterium]
MEQAETPIPAHGVVQPMQCLSEGYALISPQYMPLAAICFVGTLIGSLVPAGILMGPMFCGIHLCLQQRREGGQATFDLLFKGFDYAGDSIIAMLIFAGIYIVMYIPMVFGFLILAPLMLIATVGQGGKSSGIALAGMGGAVVLSVLAISLLVAILGTVVWSTMGLIVEWKVKPWQAVKTAFRGLMENFLGTVGLGLLCGLVHLAGALCCGIGIFFTTPIVFAAYFCAYKQVFGQRPPELVGTAKAECETL